MIQYAKEDTPLLYETDVSFTEDGRAAMRITILTMFPEMFESFLDGPIARRAADRGIADIRIVDIKDYAGGCYRHIDDSTYGGGAGMVMRAQPVLSALKEALEPGEGIPEFPSPDPGAEGSESENGPAAGCEHSADPETDYEQRDAGETPSGCGSGERGKQAGTCIAALTPVGYLYRQETAVRYSQLEHLVLVCGHYEGMDERIYSHVDERISIGDYILSGGEFAAQVVADSVLRLLPGVLREESTADESFCGRGLLEYPQYTRPADLNGEKVPEVLLSGNHEEIRRWRLRESLRATLTCRPNLLKNISLSEEEKTILQELSTQCCDGSLLSKEKKNAEF